MFNCFGVQGSVFFFQDAGTRALPAAVTNVAYIVGETGSLLMLR